jgi:virginiamycin B lyase
MWRANPLRGRKSATKRAVPGVERLELRDLPAVATTLFPIPFDPAHNPYGITVGPDGALWFTQVGSGQDFQADQIGRIDPATGSIDNFPIGNDIGYTFGITAGPDGALWFVEDRFTDLFLHSERVIVRFDPATHAVTDFRINDAPSISPSAITSGPDDAIWFVAARGIGRIDATTHATDETPVDGVFQGGITTGPDGALWFTEPSANRIGRIDPATRAVTEHTVPTAHAGLDGIAPGPDGALWFTEPDVGQIGRIDPATGAITEFPAPGGLQSQSMIAAGPDGALWFARPSVNDGPGRIDAATGAVTAFPVPEATGADAGGVASGPSGDLWYTTIGGILRVNPAAPDAGPSVTALRRTGIHLQPTHIVLTFSGPLDATRATDLANYQLCGRNGRPIALLSAAYDPTTRTVTLSPERRLKIHRPYVYQITVDGSPGRGVAGSDGAPLIGNDGPGTDYIARFFGFGHSSIRRARVTSGQRLSFTRPRPLNPSVRSHSGGGGSGGAGGQGGAGWSPRNAKSGPARAAGPVPS